MHDNQGVMKQEELARKLSQANRLSRAEARDQIDELVRKVLASLRAGTPVEFPGAGRLVSRQHCKSEK
jgi:nucleoid DNA-binding protein